MPGKSTKPILVLDFDGVIHSYRSGWQGMETITDPPVPGAIEFLKRAVFHFRVNILSSRSSCERGLAAMQEWLIVHLADTEEDLQWAGEFVHNELYWPRQKPAAFLTIDDRAVQFKGKFPSPIDLLNFKPWNKRDI